MDAERGADSLLDKIPAADAPKEIGALAARSKTSTRTVVALCIISRLPDISNLTCADRNCGDQNHRTA